MKNKAVLNFEKNELYEFSEWYTPETIECLTHLNTQGEFLRYVFFDGDYYNQLESLVMIKNYVAKSPKIKGISFISKEFGLGDCHFIFGLLIQNKLIVVNPIGKTEHADFYGELP